MKTKEAKKLQDLVVFHEAELVNEYSATLLVGGVGADGDCVVFCQCNLGSTYCKCNNVHLDDGDPIYCGKDQCIGKLVCPSKKNKNDDDGFLIHL